MVFPVAMSSCESWTIKKAECQRIDAFKLVLEKITENPLYRKEGFRKTTSGSSYSLMQVALIVVTEMGK